MQIFPEWTDVVTVLRSSLLVLFPYMIVFEILDCLLVLFVLELLACLLVEFLACMLVLVLLPYMVIVFDLNCLLVGLTLAADTEAAKAGKRQ